MRGDGIGVGEHRDCVVCLVLVFSISSLPRSPNHLSVDLHVSLTTRVDDVVTTAEALFDCVAEDESELSFFKGDEIIILNKVCLGETVDAGVQYRKMRDRSHTHTHTQHHC